LFVLPGFSDDEYFLYDFWAKKESLSAPESIKQKIKAFRLFFWEEGPLGGEPNDPV
jgi:hypothetical protein